MKYKTLEVASVSNGFVVRGPLSPERESKGPTNVFNHAESLAMHILEWAKDLEEADAGDLNAETLDTLLND